MFWQFFWRITVKREFSDKAAEIAQRWRGIPGMVTGALQEFQDTFGYLSEEGLSALAQGLDIPVSQLFSVATFYSFFRLTPKGAHHIQVCEGTACHVLGAEQVGGKLARDLKIGSEGVSEDRLFSVEKVRCLGCCSMAPVVRVDERTFGRVRQKDLAKLLRPFQNGEASGEDQEY
jgi:NADH:ubiquinone oxidoreductase subunit E